MMILDITDLVLDSVLETQIKLKILHSYKLSHLQNFSVLGPKKKHLMQVLLVFIYSLNLKKVLSGKVNTRIPVKSLQKFLLSLDMHLNDALKKNKNFSDLDYTSTYYINSLYELCVKNEI